MNQLEPEFNENVVIQSCLRQNAALEDVYREVQQNKDIYLEKMLTYEQAEMTRLQREEIHSNLLVSFEEKIKIKIALDESVLYQEANNISNELSTIFEKESKESDEFVAELNRIQTKYKNLDTEFDEEAMAREICCCKETRGLLSDHVTELETKLNLVKNFNRFERFGELELTNLRRVEKNLDIENKVVRNDFMKRHSQLILIKNNIEFLKEKNAELRTQRNLLR